MSGHQRPGEGMSGEWYTPPHVLAALGPFDDDPCLPGRSDGLTRAWTGCAYVNPPYTRAICAWLRRLADHGNGIALIFARTETRHFHEQVWPRASALLFLRGRLRFHRADGTVGRSNAGAPSVLIAYGAECTDRLRLCGLPGALVELKKEA